MKSQTISAVFDNRAEAERAVTDLRSAGISDDAISIVANRDHADVGGHETEHAKEGVKDVAGKTAAGAGIGALLGIGALAIPGVGPLIGAGAIAEAAVGGSALTGTAVGAAAGGLAGLLTDHGETDEDARYYADNIDKGGIYVSVDQSRANTDADEAREILYRHGGHRAGRQRTV